MIDALPAYCYACRGLRFWRRPDGSPVCYQCHPPLLMVAVEVAPGPAVPWPAGWRWIEESAAVQSTADRATAWVSLVHHWDWLGEVADRREANKRQRASSRYWNPQAHHLGARGEWVWAQAMGQLMDLAQYEYGDDGCDFPGIDIKATPYWRDPWLKEKPERCAVPEWRGLVAIDEAQRRGRVVGVARVEVVAAAELRGWGYGLQRSLPASALEHPRAYLAWLAAFERQAAHTKG